MIVKLAIERAAKFDMAEAYQWHKNICPELADRFYNRLHGKFNLIIQHPEAYSIAGKRLRRVLIPEFSYAIYYMLDKDTVRVFAVIHTSRNPIIWKKPEH